jgi:poly-gamma-glutamate capsule biosynthesis protein CapA/YwtB (metallophosphatase superfamily)
MSNVLIGMVGDVLVDRENPIEVFSHVRDILRVPDIMFANLEAAYTDDPRPVPSAPVVLKPPAHNLDVFANVGFNVMSMANNHIVDVGYEAMLQTRSRLRAQGVRTCGAGGSFDEAHEPALIDAKGLRVAFLAYCVGYPSGYEARAKTPGLAPMRAYRYLRDPDPSDPTDPGDLLDVITLPDKNDLAALTKDIERASAVADLVVVSFHWGDYTKPFHLTDHETRTARYCIDHGADMIVGHHHHVLRGIEWYKGKPILYGLGHFVFDLRWEWSEELLKVIASYERGAGARYTVAPRSGWPLLPMHEDARMTIIAWATANRGAISDISFLPCRLTPEGLVRPLELDSRASAEVVDYLDKCNTTQGLKSLIVENSSLSIAGFRTLRVTPG